MPDLTPHEDNSESDDPIAALLTESAEFDDAVEYISLENVLTSIDASTDVIGNSDLPCHMRCAAHTFNLVATKDADSALNSIIFKRPYRAVMAKARAIWNLQSRSTVASDNIISELGRQLVVPNTTRWNSTFDAIVTMNKIVVSKRPALHRVMTQANLPAFTDQDLALMKEYEKVTFMIFLI